MTLTPNYLRAFLKTFLWSFLLIAVFSGAVPHFRGEKVRFNDILSNAVVPCTIFGIFVAVMFTPREITWNEKSVLIRALFPGSGDFEWRRLEAWSPTMRGVFLIKFEEKQSFQISPAGYRSDEWKSFLSMMQQRFPEKKARFWIGASPIRFGRNKRDL
jgi:hypothetical protein